MLGALQLSTGLRVPISIGGTVASFRNGLPLTAAGELVAVASAPTSYSNGIPMVGAAIAVSESAPVSWNQGIPIAANGAIACDFSGAASRWEHGVPMTATGALVFDSGTPTNALRFAGAFGRVAHSVGQDSATATQPITSLTAVGTQATAVVKTTIAMFVGQTVQVTGATPTAYNGQVTITAIPDGTTFNYTCGSAPGGAGTGASVIAKLPNAGLKRSDFNATVTSSGTTATISYFAADPQVGDQFWAVGGSNQAFLGLITIASITTTRTACTYTLPSDQGGASCTGVTFYPVTSWWDGLAVEISDVLGSGDWSELRVALPLWSVALFGGTQGIVGAPGGFTIDECSISVNGTAYAPIKFGGASTKTVNLNSGTSLIVSDGVTAADFIGTGVTLTRGTPIVIKAKLTLHGFNSQLAGRTKGQGGGGTVTPRVISYNKARTSVYSVGSAYSASAFSTSAGGGTSNGNSYQVDIAGQPLPAFNVLGRPVDNATKSLLAIGDSITQSQLDSVNIDNTGATVTNAAAGRVAWFSRSLWDASFSLSSAVAGMNCAIIGTQPFMYTTALQGASLSWFTDWMDYCTHYVDADGTNGFGGANKTASEALWAVAKGKGKTIIRTSLFPHTSASSDSYKTTTGQTIFAGWGIGSLLDTQEGLWQTQTSDHVTYPNGPDYYLQFLSPRQSGANDRTQAAYWQWKVDGVTNFYATTDGLHPTPAIHVLMANEARTFWASLP